MVDSKENYKFDLGVKGLCNSCKCSLLPAAGECRFIVDDKERQKFGLCLWHTGNENKQNYQLKSGFFKLLQVL